MNFHLLACIPKLQYHPIRPILKQDNQIVIKIYFIYFFSPSIRISGKNINFKNKKNQQKQFLQKRKPFKIEGIDINNIRVSKQESYGEKNPVKYFIGHNDDGVIGPLCIRLPQMIGYVNVLIVIRQCLLRSLIRSY